VSDGRVEKAGKIERVSAKELEFLFRGRRKKGNTAVDERDTRSASYRRSYLTSRKLCV